MAPLAQSMLRHDPSSGRSIQQVILRLKEGPGTAQLTRAWEETVEQTEALQHGFGLDDPRSSNAEPVVVVETGSIDLEDWLEQDRSRPLDLAGGRPWRCHYFEPDRVWVWTLHHALLDGSSLVQVMRRFLASVESPGHLEKRERKRWLEADAATQAAASRHFSALAEQVDELQPEFPMDSEGPTYVSQELGPSILRLLSERADELDLTPATVVTWAWGQAVAASCGTSAVALGQVREGPPQAGRIGFSMNTLPAVVERGGADSLARFQAQLRRLQAFETIAPEQLTELGWQTAGGLWPAGVVLVEEGSFAQQLQPPKWVESVELREESDEPKLASAHLAPNLQLEVETRDQRGASTLLRLWSEILVRFATMPEEPPVRLPQAMREQIESLETTVPPLAHEHLAVAWKHAAESFAKHMAIETEDHQITYSELDRRIEHLASRLEISGIVAGSIVASELKDRCFFPIILLACARLDAIHLPLDPELPLERRRAMVSDANPALLLTDLPMEGGRHGLRTMGLDHESSSQATSAMPKDPRSPLTLLYTSGSTGKPKGVIMTHGGVCNEVHAIAREAGLAPGEKLLQFASPGFDAALEEVLSPLLSGATLTPRPESLKADFLAFQRYIDHHQVTVLDLSTAHWAAWCAWMKLESREIPESIKTTIIGGERATSSALDDWFHCGGRRHLLLNTYGPTEASIVATLERIDAQWQGNGDPTIGRPLPGVHIRIGDAHGATLPPGAAGEIWIGGNCIGPGYWQDPDRTAKAFHQIDGLSWYRTRDRACWDKEGRLRFLGRVDDQLKIRGNRIEPAEVSRELESFPGVSAAHVGPVKGPDGALALAAWVRWDGSTDKRWPAKLHEHCRTRLPAASIPTRWAEVSEFKLTERGKIDQQQLPKPELTSSSQGTSESPETETEVLLAAIWQKILGLSFIGRNESFFELGGDSISALQMFAQVYRQFGRRMPVSTIIETPSLKGIAGILDDSKPIDGGRPRLHTISGTKQQSPLICFHGGDGGVVFYRPMARNLSIDRQIVAIESPLLSLEGAMPETPVTEMAQSYLDEILKHQTSGPYHLLGYSFGGLLAYEVARLLRARGETIAFIGMVDTLNPATPTPPYNLIQRAARCWSTSPDPSLAGRLLRLGTRASEGLATHFRVRGEERQIRQVPDSEPFSPLRALKVRAIHERVGLAFQPQALDTTVHLFRASIPSDKFSIPDDYGWSALASELEIHEAPGSHLTMFDDENFGQLASLISKALSTPQE